MMVASFGSSLRAQRMLAKSQMKKQTATATPSLSLVIQTVLMTSIWSSSPNQRKSV